MLNMEVVNWVISTNYNNMANWMQAYVQRLQMNIPRTPSDEYYMSVAVQGYKMYKQQFNQNLRTYYQGIMQYIRKQYIMIEGTMYPLEGNNEALRTLVLNYIKLFSISRWYSAVPRLKFGSVKEVKLPKSDDFDLPDTLRVPFVGLLEKLDVDTRGQIVPIAQTIRGAFGTLYKEVVNIQYYVKTDLSQVVKDYLMTYGLPNISQQEFPTWANKMAIQFIQNNCYLESFPVYFYFNPYTVNGQEEKMIRDRNGNLQRMVDYSFGSIYYKVFNVKEIIRAGADGGQVNVLSFNEGDYNSQPETEYMY